MDRAGIAADGDFGPMTAAVGAFKSKRNILNTQGQIDKIVGKKTVAALDNEILSKENSRSDALRNIKPGVIRELGKPAVVIVPSFNSSEVVRGVTDTGGGKVVRRFGIGSDGDLQPLVPLTVVPGSF